MREEAPQVFSKNPQASISRENRWVGKNKVGRRGSGRSRAREENEELFIRFPNNDFTISMSYQSRKLIYLKFYGDFVRDRNEGVEAFETG